MSQKPIVFFDGVCHLCNGFVDSVVLRDPKHRFCFAPLQGTTAQAHLSANDINDLDSVILMQNGKIYKKSTAVLKILSGLGGFHSLWGLFLVLPSFIRNWIYDLIAKRRYIWFGEREFCRLPTPEEREFLLP